MTQRFDDRFSRRSSGSNSDLQRLLDDAARRRQDREAATFATTALEQVEADITEQARIERIQNQALVALPDMLQLQQPPQQEEQSTGFLGKLFSPFTFLQERVIEPGAGVLTDLGQKAIPGEQEIERKVREFRSQGVGPIEARRRAFVESDLPTTEVSLPFKIPLPAGRSLQDFDIGVKGAIELIADPLNLLFGIGTAAKIPGAAGKVLARGLIPEGVRALRGGAKVVPANPGPGIKRKIPTITPDQLQEAADEAIAAAQKAPTPSSAIATRAVRSEFEPKLPGFGRRMIPNQRVMRNLRNSKVADETGLPLVVYHGSQNIFEVFDPSRANPDALFGPGAYFTENPDVASGYAGTARRTDTAPNVTPVFLRITNPLDMDAPMPQLIRETVEAFNDPSVMSLDMLDDILEKLDIEDISEIVTSEEAYRLLQAEYFVNNGTSSGGKAEINEFLQTLGFDGITHIGGARTRTAPHRVWIALAEVTSENRPTSAFSPRLTEDKELIFDSFTKFENQIFGALENQRAPLASAIVEPAATAVPIPTKVVPAMQFQMPGFRSAQGDLLESRIQNVVESGQADNIHDAISIALEQQAVDAGLPPGHLPAPLAAHYGAAANDAPGSFTEMVNMIPGEDAGTNALRKWDGARTVGAADMQAGWENGQKLLRSKKFGKWDGKRMVVTRETGQAMLMALHGEGPLPAGMEEIFADLKNILAVEQADMLAVEPQMAKSFANHPDYFPRLWSAPKVTKTSGTRALGATPFFKKPRVDATFTELLESGYEPSSWNPYDLVALRRISGVEYREAKNLIDKLHRTGQAIPQSELPKGSGWRVPDAGMAFTGKPFAMADGTAGLTPRIAVPAHVANVIESTFGKRPQLLIKDKDVLGSVRFFSNAAKRTKLFGSLFQHIDFGTRAGGLAFSPSGLSRGLPVKYPSLIARLMNVSLRKAPRDALRKRILSDKPLYDDFDISLRKVAEGGWQIGGDLSIFRRGVMDFMDDSLKGAPASVAGIAARRAKNVATFMEDGLFDGVYRETQSWALENSIIPNLRKNHPTWTVDQIAGSAATEVNKMFSTLGEWQSIFSHPGTRELTRTILFSANESESWIRAAVSTVKGPNKKLWQDYGLGMMIFMGSVANLVNFQATGQTLSAESYLPIQTNDPYSFLPGGVSYNGKFLSPQINIAGRGEVPVSLDVVGQADTFFRWLLDPPGALTSRYNVLPRAIVNQAQGHDFYGRPIEGLRDRAIQALDDLALPIGPGYFSDIVREKVPVTQGFLASREARLGTLGSVIQSTGLNLRAISTPDMLDRAAAVSGFETADGQIIRSWSELEPAQRRALEQAEPLASEMQRRNMTSIERGMTSAKAREQRKLIDTARLDQERALQSMFITGEINGRDSRTRYDQIQSEAIARRSQLSSDFQDLYNEGIEPEDPNDLALAQFYQGHEAARNTAGVYDGDVATANMAELERAWSPDQLAFVQRNTGLTEHPEVLGELRTGRRRFGSYWRVHRMVLNGDSAAIERYETFVGIFGEPRQEALQNFPELAEIQQVVSATRERMRTLSPELDAFLFQWGYPGTLKHPSNLGRERELAPWLTGALRKLGA